MESLMKVGDPVKYIGKRNMCTDGTWVIIGRTYIISEIKDNIIFLKNIAGSYMLYEFELSTMEVYNIEQNDHAKRIHEALMDLKQAIGDYFRVVNRRYR